MRVLIFIKKATAGPLYQNKSQISHLKGLRLARRTPRVGRGRHSVETLFAVLCEQVRAVRQERVERRVVQELPLEGGRVLGETPLLDCSGTRGSQGEIIGAEFQSFRYTGCALKVICRPTSECKFGASYIIGGSKCAHTLRQPSCANRSCIRNIARLRSLLSRYMYQRRPDFARSPVRQR